MKKEVKVIKLNEEEILSILGEYFNFSGKKYVQKGIKSTMLNLYGKADEDLRLVCVLSSDTNSLEIDLEEVDKKFDFTGDESVNFKI